MRQILFGLAAVSLLQVNVPGAVAAQDEPGPRVVSEVWAAPPAAFRSSPLAADSAPLSRALPISLPTRDSTVPRCEESGPENRCEGKLRWGSILGAGVGIGAAVLFCSSRSCEVAGFALMFAGGYVGSRIGHLLQCGWGAVPPPRRPR